MIRNTMVALLFSGSLLAVIVSQGTAGAEERMASAAEGVVRAPTAEAALETASRLRSERLAIEVTLVRALKPLLELPAGERRREDEMRLHALLAALEVYGGHDAASLLATHVRYEPTKYVAEAGGGLLIPLIGRYPCASALVQIGLPSLDPLARVLAHSDDPATIRLARLTIYSIGLVPHHVGQMDEAGDRFAEAYLRDVARIDKDPARRQRLERSVVFFARRMGHSLFEETRTEPALADRGKEVGGAKGKE